MNWPWNMEDFCDERCESESRTNKTIYIKNIQRTYKEHIHEIIMWCHVDSLGGKHLRRLYFAFLSVSCRFPFSFLWLPFPFAAFASGCVPHIPLHPLASVRCHEMNPSRYLATGSTDRHCVVCRSNLLSLPSLAVRLAQHGSTLFWNVFEDCFELI